jgi:putative oxidoreductase
MTLKMNLASFLLRLALAATYVSAYSSRINLFGGHGDGWQQFLKYASEVNSYAPNSLKPFLAIAATVLEIVISILLIIGFKTRTAAVASGVLTFIFAIAMTYSYGIKEPLDYGVFVNFAAAFLLSTMPGFKWSADQYLSKKNKSVYE